MAAFFRFQRIPLFQILTIIIVLVVNWWAGATIVKTMSLYERVAVIENFFSITHIRNPGAAFGMLSKLDPSYRLPLLLCITFVALIFIGYFLIKSRQDPWTMRVGLSLLAGGAIGNFYERLIYGEVVDYLDFYLGNYHWPAFNIADVSISTGIGFIVLYTILKRKDEKISKKIKLNHLLIKMKKGGEMMLKKMLSGMAFLVFLSLFLAIHGFAQEDKIGQIAIETIKTHMRFPPGVEVKFIEKKESPIPGFYSVKLSLLSADREVPMIIYVDKAGEIVIIGNIFIKGENVTRKEAGPPKPRKIDMGQLAIDKSPWRGSNHAKVTIVEFSNFQCPSCLSSWKKMKDLMEKNPQDIKYVFKHFPFQSQGNAFELHELVAATQAVNNEAFWAVHDFFFSDEGQAFVNQGKDVLKHKIEQVLKERGFDIKTFQVALRNGEGKKRVEEDFALGKKFGVTRTPTAVINGDFLVDPLPEMITEQYLGK